LLVSHIFQLERRRGKKRELFTNAGKGLSICKICAKHCNGKKKRKEKLRRLNNVEEIGKKIIYVSLPKDINSREIFLP
jgi:hypothetical protein